MTKSLLNEVIEMTDRIHRQGPSCSTLAVHGPPDCTFARLPKPAVFPTGCFRVQLVRVDAEGAYAWYRVPTNPTTILEIEIPAFDGFKEGNLMGSLDDETVVDLIPEPKLNGDEHQVGWMRLVDPADLLDYLVEEELP